ncbi:ABC transporter permease [Microvirga sp. BT689]|uniref:ABC transporter permease n=1 Tax=Microvirga arvi TaxID=2778731 RepID=UPI001950965F|nr:ABC transporter permease [Microvirga arvi]MBM6581901.1 ABC transporter permease [Microvirga arvi]
MWTFIARRLLQSLVVVFGVTLISFVALHMGGDPTYLYVSERASQEEIQETRAKLGFDKPLHIQYATYIERLAQGDFGTSLTYRTPAIDVVLERFPATIELTLFAMSIAIFAAIPIGVISALYRGTAIDGTAMTMAMIGQSLPSFWLGIMLILYVGLGLRWLPISGHSPLLDPLIRGEFATAFANFPSAVEHLILPGVTIAFFSLARNARLVRSSMLEVLNQDYVRTARAKGLSEYTVVVAHALRNAWLPVVTMFGLEFGFLLSGVVVVETIFAWPGVGRLVFNAINQRDIPLVQAAVVVFALLFVLLNLVTDILYAKLDPRIRLG